MYTSITDLNPKTTADRIMDSRRQRNTLSKNSKSGSQDDLLRGQDPDAPLAELPQNAPKIPTKAKKSNTKVLVHPTIHMQEQQHPNTLLDRLERKMASQETFVP